MLSRRILTTRCFSTMQREKLVIIGTGWAGYKLLIESKKYRKKWGDKKDVVVISERNVR